jgi:hypothetical protein
MWAFVTPLWGNQRFWAECDSFQLNLYLSKEKQPSCQGNVSISKNRKGVMVKE